MEASRQAASAQAASTHLVHLVRQLLHAVVCLGYSIGIERVSLNDVSSSSQVLCMDLTDDVRLRQAQQVIVALDILMPVFVRVATIVSFS